MSLGFFMDLTAYGCKAPCAVFIIPPRWRLTCNWPTCCGRTLRLLRPGLRRGFVQPPQGSPVHSGLIAVFGCVEPCRTYFMRGNRETKMLELKLQRGKCLHFYFYCYHPLFGFMHLRLQSWFPFLIHITLNGREWLSRQMDAAGVPYQRKENCFTALSDVVTAQALFDGQLQTDWPAVCNQLVRDFHPMHEQICRPLPLSYYWSASESEYASDVMFR